MQKLLNLLFILSPLLFFVCTIERNNPLDQHGGQFVPPHFTVDTLLSSIANGDTVYTDSINVYLTSNNPIEKYRARLDLLPWTQWQAVDEIIYTNIINGRHALYFESKYENGDTITVDSIIFFVFVKVQADTTKPTIQLLKPEMQGTSVSTPQVKIEAIIKDDKKLERVKYTLGTDTFPVIKFDSLTFYAIITGLQPAVRSDVVITATDSAGNKTDCIVSLTYDQTMLDNQPPQFTWVSGGQVNQRVTTASGFTRFTITDQSSIGNVYFKINDTLQGSASIIAPSIYEFNYILPHFGENRLVLYAVDNSTQHNLGSQLVLLNFNTKPTTPDSLKPIAGTTKIPYSNGIQFSWKNSTDQDNDPVLFTVYYAAPNGIFSHISTTKDSLTIKGFEGSTVYNWYLITTTPLDTIRTPSADGLYFTFTTSNYPTVVTGFNDTTATINDTIQFHVSASDIEGIKSFCWDLNGDGVIEKITYDPIAEGKMPAIAGIYTATLFVVDTRGDTTRFNSKINITNRQPSVKIGADSIFIDYQKPITLAPVTQDDGRIVWYGWDFEGRGNFINVANGDTSFASPTDSLPRILKYTVKVKDEDNNTASDTVTVRIDMDWLKAKTDSTMLLNGFASCLHKGTFYVMGGSVDMYSQSRSVWRSNNGTTWQEVTKTADWSARYGHEAFSLKDTLYTVGGWNGYVCNNDIWGSVDNGVSWKKIRDLPNYYSLGIINFRTSVDSGFLRILGGTGTDFMNSIDYDTVFGGWDIASLEKEAWLPKCENPCYSNSGDTAWLLGGPKKTGLWIYRYGYWRNIADSCAVAPFNAGALTVAKNAMWLFTDNATWLSINRGKNWRKIQQTPPWAGCNTIRVYTYNNATWIISDKGIWHYDKTL